MTRFYLPKEICIHILMSSCCFLIYHSGSCSCREYLTLSERQQCLPKPNLPIFMEAGFEHPSGVGLTQPSQTLLSGQFGRHHSTVSQSEWFFFSHYPDEGETQGDGPPSSSHCFCTSQSCHCRALQRLHLFLALNVVRCNIFYSTFNNMETGV